MKVRNIYNKTGIALFLGILIVPSILLGVAPPVIEQEPGDVLTVGGSHTWLVVGVADADSQPSLSYQWYTGISGDTALPLNGTDRPVIKVTPVNDTNYWVRVTNAADSTDSRTVTVTISDAYFFGLGDLDGGDYYSEARGADASGAMIVGNSSKITDGYEPVFWTQSGGIQTLPEMNDTDNNLFITASDITPDGRFIAGRALNNDGYREAVIWDDRELSSELGFLADEGFIYNRSALITISDDGITGYGFSLVEEYNNYTYKTFRWTETGGMVDLGVLGGYSPLQQLFPSMTTPDGSVLTGDADIYSDEGSWLASRAWIYRHGEGLIDLGTLPGGDSSAGKALTSDGSIVVGLSNTGDNQSMWEGFTWTAAGGMQPLGLPDTFNQFSPTGISDDGSVIVGSAFQRWPLAGGGETYVWRCFVQNSNGFTPLKTALEELDLDLADWTLDTVNMNSNGTVLWGRGTNPDGNSEAWMAAVPAGHLATFGSIVYDFEIVGHPASMTGYTGESFTLQVVVEGQDGMLFQWYKDGQVIEGAEHCFYTIDDPVLADAGDYFCKLTSSDELNVVDTDVATVSLSEPVPVVFADSNLEAAIIDALGLDQGPVYQHVLAGMTGLYVNDLNITSLAGLEYATSLRSLEASGNLLTSLAPLAGLTELSYLNLGRNHITDISDLSTLTNLYDLQLWTNQIQDLSALSGLTGLVHLNVGDNQITDISVLSNLISLQTLDLNWNSVSSLDALAGLATLTHLYLGYNQISDISSLAGLGGLKHVFLPGNGLSDIQYLSGLTSLVSLDLSDNAISDISALSGLTSLTSLQLSANQITDLLALSNLTALLDLDISYNTTLANLLPLAGLTNLERLYLGGNSISNIQPLAGMTVLTELYLENNAISDVSPLGGLVLLEYLNLNSNAIVDVSGLASLTAMMSLELGDNQIAVMDAVSGMSDLTYLHMGGNQITAIPDLAALTSLTNLHLHANQLTQIDNLATLGSLEILNLSWNSIASLEPLSGMGSLLELWAAGNQITGLSPLIGLGNLVALDLGGNQISDLQYLSGQTNLDQLYLWGNRITDVSALAGLTGLDRLGLASNQISSVDALDQLLSLTFLDLSFNQIENINSLGVLASLEILVFNDNWINDIGGLNDYPQLAEVNLARNYIDLSAGTPSGNLVAAWIDAEIQVNSEPQYGPPGFSHEPGDCMSLPGGDIWLVAFAEENFSQPAAEYQWYEGVSGDRSHPLADSNKTMIQLYPSETTQYWVEISNPAGGTASRTVTASFGDVFFSGLGDLPGGEYWSEPRGVSAFGSMVVGNSNSEFGDEPVCWTQSGGLHTLPEYNGSSYEDFITASDISPDSQWIAGRMLNDDFNREAVIWGHGAIDQALGFMQDGLSWDVSALITLSDDQSIGYGWGYHQGNDAYQTFEWTPENGIVHLGMLPGYGANQQIFPSTGRTATRDGGVLVGDVDIYSDNWDYQYSRGFIYRRGQGMTELPPLAGYYSSGARAVSSDGTVVLGVSNRENSNYFEGTVWIDGGDYYSIETPVSFRQFSGSNYSDDDVIVGGAYQDWQNASGQGEWQWRPFIYNSYGYSPLQPALEALGLNLSDWILQTVNMNYSATILWGRGLNMTNGETEGWVAFAPAGYLATVGSSPLEISLIHHPVDYSGFTSDPFTLEVLVSGQDGMTFQWFKDGQAIPSANSWQYTVEEPVLSDSGDYTCIITAVNDSQVLTSDAATVQLDIPVPVVFEDPELENHLVNYFILENGPIYQHWMLDIEFLDLSGIGVTSLVGLEYAANLRELHLNDNPVADFSPLISLLNLENLFLTNVPLADYGILADLPALSMLNLEWNNLADISFLSDLPGLSSLSMAHNRIQDISPLAGLSNLNWLYLQDNQITDISLLSSLSSLQQIDISDNFIHLEPEIPSGQLVQTWLDNWVDVISDPQNGPPVFIREPVDSVAINGGETWLSVPVSAVDDQPWLVYQWYEGPSGYTYDPIDNSDTPLLNITPASDAEYWVEVTNPVGTTASGTIVVTLVDAYFSGLGDLPGGAYQSEPRGVTPNGGMVVGNSTSGLGFEPVFWTMSGGMQKLPEVNEGPPDWFVTASAITPDGQWIAGRTWNNRGLREAAIWNKGRIEQTLGFLQEDVDWNVSALITLSDDGTIGYGWAGEYVDDGTVFLRKTFRWTEVEGMVNLGLLPTHSYQQEIYPWKATPDGSAVVGEATFYSPTWEPIGNRAWLYRHGQGMVDLGTLPGGDGAYGFGISRDGSTALGWANIYLGDGEGYEWPGFIWTQVTGMQSLGLPETFREFHAQNITDDRSVIAGSARVGWSETEGDIWIWRPFIINSNGFVPLQAALEAAGLDLSGWTLETVNMNWEGNVVWGRGSNPQGETEAWVAAVPDGYLAGVDASGLDLRIEGQSADLAVYPDQPFEFEVFVSGTDGMTFQWYHDDQAITGATESVYSVDAAVPADAGDYFCRVTSGSGAQVLDSASSLLTVMDPVPVVFDDDNLEAAVLAGLGLESGPVYEHVIPELTILYAENLGMTSLAGLEYATSLEHLNLEGNAITDLGPIAGLTGLISLDCDHNNISDLGPLANLTELRTLSCDYNMISNLSPLENLTNLEFLYLQYNQLTNIDSLGALTGLEQLYLEWNYISDISVLGQLTALQELTFGYNFVTDISVLSPLDSLSLVKFQLNYAYDININGTPNRDQYQSWITNGYTAVTSYGQIGPASISREPGDVLIRSGDTARLSVEVPDLVTHPGVFYQWYEGVSGDTSNPVADSNIPYIEVAPAHSSNYWVSAANPLNTVSSRTVAVVVVDAWFTGVGDLAGGDYLSQINDVTPGGGIAVGSSASDFGLEPVVWTQSAGLQKLPEYYEGASMDENYPGQAGASAITPDGGSIGGFTMNNDGTYVATIWEDGALEINLGFLDPSLSRPNSKLISLSDDGSVGYGQSTVFIEDDVGFSFNGDQTFRWTESEGMANIGPLPGYPDKQLVYPMAATPDGAAAAGFAVIFGDWAAIGERAFVYRHGQGMIDPGLLSGGDSATARDISSDGSLVIGSANTILGDEEYWDGFLWSEANGMQSLGRPESLNGFSPESISDIDGAVVGNGTFSNISQPEPGEGIIRPYILNSNGFVPLQLALEAIGLDLVGWTLKTVKMNRTGDILWGSGINPQGDTEAWIAAVPDNFLATAGDSDLPIELLENPVGYTVEAGEPFILQVVVAGQDGMTYEWFRDSQIIDGADSWIYSVDVADAQDAGDYYCRVSSANGTESVETLLATMTVEAVISAEAWIAEMLPPETPEELRGLLADADGDGISNLLEYALGLHPGQANSLDLLAVSETAATQAFEFSFRCRVDDPALSFACSVSNDMQQWTAVNLNFDSQNQIWTSGSSEVEISSASNLGDGIWELTLRDNSGFDPLFMRTDFHYGP